MHWVKRCCNLGQGWVCSGRAVGRFNLTVVLNQPPVQVIDVPKFRFLIQPSEEVWITQFTVQDQVLDQEKLDGLLYLTLYLMTVLIVGLCGPL